MDHQAASLDQMLDDAVVLLASVYPLLWNEEPRGGGPRTPE